MKLKDLAKLVKGETIGDSAVEIRGVAQVEEAKKGDLVFVLDSKFLSHALASKASALIAPLKSEIKEKPALLVENPRLAMAQVLSCFRTVPSLPKVISKTAVIPKSCKIGEEVSIGANVVLGEKVTIGNHTLIYPNTYIGDGSSVGDDCVIHANVTIYEKVKIGNHVIIHSGSSIGLDGFGFVQKEGKHLKIPQLGSVRIEDEVEIFSNVTVARGTLGPTVIGRGTKIDCLTHVAHNCKLGANCAIVSLVGLSGSVTLKDHVFVGGQSGFSGHNTIGENSVIMARAGITKDFPPNSVVSGFPAQDHRQEMASQAFLRRLTKKNK